MLRGNGWERREEEENARRGRFGKELKM